MVGVIDCCKAIGSDMSNGHVQELYDGNGSPEPGAKQFFFRRNFNKCFKIYAENRLTNESPFWS